MTTATISFRTALVGWIVGTLAATSLQAQIQVNEKCAGAGEAVGAAFYDSGAPFDIQVAASSFAYGNFVLRDAQGRWLSNADVEITLPDDPPGFLFYAYDAVGAFLPTTTPKKAVVRTPYYCIASFPQFVAGPRAGTYSASARVAGSSNSFTIPIRVRTDFKPIEYLGRRPIRLVTSEGASLRPYGAAEWSEGVYFGPLSGVAVKFTAPAMAPTIRFANGSHEITVETGAFGGASAQGVAVGKSGAFDIVATFPNGFVANAYRIDIVGMPSVALTSAAQLTYGTPEPLAGQARYPGYPCDLATVYPGSPAPSVEVSTPYATWRASVTGMDPGCSAEGATFGFRYSVAQLPFGSHDIVAEVSPNLADVSKGRSTPMTVAIRPAATLALEQGGTIRVGNADPAYPAEGGNCRLASARTLAPSVLPGTLPAGTDFPRGAVQLEMRDCTWNSLALIAPGGTPFPPRGPIAQRVLIGTDDDLPAGTMIYAYGSTPEEAAPHWYELRTGVTGRLAMVDVIDGGAGDDSLVRDSVLRPTLALGVPRYAAVPGSFQDLWWAGPGENGWGLTITQHRDVLFAALFVYDAQGEPRWFVVPGGAWNAGRTQYTGSVYRPKGTPLAVNIATGFNIGPPVGSARFTLTGRDTMTLDYTIDSVSGTKRIERQRYGPAHPYPAVRIDDLWWGGATESGWGFALTQQYQAHFGVLYTYDANGDPIWFVVQPDTPFQSARLASRIYRTRGSPWLGALYDSSLFSIVDVGSLKLDLGDGWSTGALSGAISGWRSFNYLVKRQPF